MYRLDVDQLNWLLHFTWRGPLLISLSLSLSLCFFFFFFFFFFFCSHRLLCEYEYIHQCRKFASAVELVVVEKKKPSAVRDNRFSIPDLHSLLYSSHLSKCVSIKEANALLDSYHAKELKFRSFLESQQSPVSQ